MADSFNTRSTLAAGGAEYEIFRLDRLADRFELDRLPFSLKILLENLLRHEDGAAVTAGDVEALAGWDAGAEPATEIAFTPSRVLLQDFTGVPAVVDLAAMRDAMRALGGDPAKINPLSPVELVIDHSVQVDRFASPDALARNNAIEFERNRERYAFLRWGQKAFRNFKVVPPGTGIVHQINLEYLARVVFAREHRGVTRAYPDTVVGTDSHTTMVNGLGVLGWGVGGIEAEAAMLGQPISMLIPQVVGFELTGKLPRAPPPPTSCSPWSRCFARRASSASSSSSSATASTTCRSPTARRSRTWPRSTARPAASSPSTRRASRTCASRGARNPRSPWSRHMPAPRACSASPAAPPPGTPTPSRWTWTRSSPASPARSVPRTGSRYARRRRSSPAISGQCRTSAGTEAGEAMATAGVRAGAGTGEALETAAAAMDAGTGVTAGVRAAGVEAGMAETASRGSPSRRTARATHSATARW